MGVVELTGSDVIGGSPVSEAEAGLLTTDGQGNGSISLDQNDGGTLTQLHKLRNLHRGDEWAGDSVVELRN